MTTHPGSSDTDVRGGRVERLRRTSPSWRQVRQNAVPTAGALLELGWSFPPASWSRRVTDPTSAAGLKWLETQLTRSSPGARLLGVQAIEHAPGTTDHRRLALDWGGRVDDVPTSVFVKSTSTMRRNRTMAAVLRLAGTEIDFYERLHHEVADLSARGLAHRRGHGGRFQLVLEDLGDGRAEFADVAEGCSLGYAFDAIDTMARLHGRFWGTERFATDLRWLVSSARRHGMALHHRYHDGYAERVLRADALELPDGIRNLMAMVVAHRWRLDEWWDAVGPPTVCHGDTQLSNTYRAAGSGVRLLDWQLVHRAHGARDLANFLASALATDLRRRHELELLERYCDELARLRVPGVPSVGQLRDVTRLFMLQALGTAVVGLAFASALSVDGDARVILNRRRLDAVADWEVEGYMRWRLARC